MTLSLDRAGRRLYQSGGRVFLPGERRWAEAEVPPLNPLGDTEALSPQAAVAWWQKDSGAPLRPPAGVVGPREASAEQREAAEAVGKGLAGLGLTVLCGGREGVMEAVCRGVAEAGGLAVGLLPDDDWTAANPFVTLPLATGLGVARNAVIARAAVALLAVGGGHGTTSEMAFALQFGRPVLALAGAPDLPGVARFETVEAALDALCEKLLAIDG